MQILKEAGRWLLIPVALVLIIWSGLYVPDVLGAFGLHKDTNLAVYFPLAGLLAAYYFAPRGKVWALLVVFVLGMKLAWDHTFPVYWPEESALAGQPTYGPFWTTVVVAVTTLGVLVGKVWRNSKGKASA